MHGGARGSGGQPSSKNTLKHDLWSAETVRMRKQVSHMVREAKQSARELV